MEHEMMDSITYKQWLSVDKYNFETFTKSAQELVYYFCEQLVTLKAYSFIIHNQSFYAHVKRIFRKTKY